MKNAILKSVLLSLLMVGFAWAEGPHRDTASQHEGAGVRSSRPEVEVAPVLPKASGRSSPESLGQVLSPSARDVEVCRKVGSWTTLPSACANLCSTAEVSRCPAVQTQGCDCGPGRCWSESERQCIDGTSPMEALRR